MNPFQTQRGQERYKFLRRLVKSLVGLPVKPEAKLEFLKMANQLYCDPKLSDEEVVAIYTEHSWKAQWEDYAIGAAGN
jgi:hypothetical protein